MVRLAFQKNHPSGEKINHSYFTRIMKILSCKTAKSNRNITARAGLTVPAVLPERLKLGAIIDQRMPAPGSNRGYRHGTLFHAFMLMLHEGAKHLDDIVHLRKDRGLMTLPGFQSIPCSSTLGNWLRSVGKHRASRNVLPEVNRQLLQASLGTRDPVTLDIDATVIHAKRKTADRTCKGKRVFAPMAGHVAETGQVLHVELRKGKVPPSARNVEFLNHCIEALPSGVRVSGFRADAASCQARVINLCREQGARFAIRARMSRNVRDLIAGIPESEWQPVVHEDGSLSETGFLARTWHAMGETPEAFCRVVQKTRVPGKVKPKDPDTPARADGDQDAGTAVESGGWGKRPERRIRLPCHCDGP